MEVGWLAIKHDPIFNGRCGQVVGVKIFSDLNLLTRCQRSPAFRGHKPTRDACVKPSNDFLDASKLSSWTSWIGNWLSQFSSHFVKNTTSPAGDLLADFLKQEGWYPNQVSTHLKNISQIGSFPQVGVKIKKYLTPPTSQFLSKRWPNFVFGSTVHLPAFQPKKSHQRIPWRWVCFFFLGGENDSPPKKPEN